MTAFCDQCRPGAIVIGEKQMLLFIVECRRWLFLERLIVQGRLGIGFKEPDSYLKLENRTD